MQTPFKTDTYALENELNITIFNQLLKIQPIMNNLEMIGKMIADHDHDCRS